MSDNHLFPLDKYIGPSVAIGDPFSHSLQFLNPVDDQICKEGINDPPDMTKNIFLSHPLGILTCGEATLGLSLPQKT